uniref:Filaggrin n=1 Tax=Mus spicilegus TaxID=10103 RepID=A0A8C6GP17_MUSSI
MSALLESITSMIEIFQQYSTSDKEEETLSKEELKELLEGQLQAVLKNPDDQDIAEVFMQMLDVDHDDKLDFAEYLLLVLKLAKAYYEASKNESFQTHGSNGRSKTDYKGLEEEGEEGNEQNLRRRRGGTDGKRKSDRTRSPNGKRGKRQGSNCRSEGKDKHRRETEKHRHQQESKRKQRHGSGSTERKDNRNKKHRQSKERNYDEIYDNGKYNEDWEASYNNCYYKSQNNILDQREGNRRPRADSQKEPQSSHGQADSNDSEGGRQQSHSKPSPVKADQSRSRAGQADSPRVSARSGSGGRGQSPEGSGRSSNRRDRTRQPSPSQSSDSQVHSGAQVEARRGQSSSANRRAGSSSAS